MVDILPILGLAYDMLLHKYSNDIGVRIIGDLNLLEDEQWYFVFTIILYSRFVKYKKYQTSLRYLANMGVIMCRFLYLFLSAILPMMRP